MRSGRAHRWPCRGARTPRAALVLAGCASLAAGCGTLGGEEASTAELPNRGVVPYRWASDPSGPPTLLLSPELFSSEPGVELRSPSAVVRDGAIDLYLEVRGPTSSSIAVARLDAAGTGLVEVLHLELPGARDPAFVRAGAVVHAVFATSGGRELGHAVSEDGRTFAVDPAPLWVGAGPAEAGGIGAPSLAISSGAPVLLAYEARAEAGAPASIALAEGSALGSLERLGTILGAGEGCSGADGREAACWDAEGVESPELRRATTAAGRTVHRLMYTGRGRAGTGIGFAAWFEPAQVERSPYNPIVDDEDLDEAAPSNLRWGDLYLLYLTRAGGIAVAINDQGAPSETF